MSDIEHTIDNLIDICERPECYDICQDIFSSFYELAEHIETEKMSGKSISNEIKSIIEEKRLDLNLCPKCGKDLSAKEVKLNHGEAWGKHYIENGYKKCCLDCGWIEEN